MMPPTPEAVKGWRRGEPKGSPLDDRPLVTALYRWSGRARHLQAKKPGLERGPGFSVGGSELSFRLNREQDEFGIQFVELVRL
jgi:hypothetical protein